MTTTAIVNCRTFLAAVPLASAAPYGAGLFGAGATLAATNKPVSGRRCQALQTPRRRQRAGARGGQRCGRAVQPDRG